MRLSLVPPVPADHYFIGVIRLSDRDYFWLSDAPEALLQSPVDCILSRGVRHYIKPQRPDLKTNQMSNSMKTACRLKFHWQNYYCPEKADTLLFKREILRGKMYLKFDIPNFEQLKLV